MDTILKNSKLNKVFAIVAAFLLAVSFSLTSVFALSSTDTGTITVNNLEDNAEVNIYKIIDVNWVGDQPKEPMYIWNDQVADYIRTNYSTYIGIDRDNSVQDVFGNLDAAKEKAFLNDIASQNLNVAANTQTATGGSVQFTVPMGVYLIKVTELAGSKFTYQVTSAELLPVYDTSWTLPAVEVNVKAVPKSTTKDVDETSDNTVAVGDSVRYKVNTYVPSFSADAQNPTFYVRDTYSAGLAFDATEAKITINDVPLTDDIATISKGTTAERKSYFQINFTLDYIKKHLGQALEIKYNLIVNSNAVSVDDLGNEALTYWNDPSTGEDSTKGETEVYTYGITVTKVNTGGTVLAGAEFQLKNANGGVLKFNAKDEGKYTYNSTGSTSTLKTNADGKIIIQGIDLGNYTLTETKAPNGYVLPANPDVTINLVDNSSATGEVKADGILDDGSGAQGNIVSATVQDTPNDNILEFGITNKTSDEAGFELPNTGGTGTLIFTIGGILLMAGAVIYLVVSKKKA